MMMLPYVPEGLMPPDVPEGYALCVVRTRKQIVGGTIRGKVVPKQRVKGLNADARRNYYKSIRRVGTEMILAYAELVGDASQRAKLLRTLAAVSKTPSARIRDVFSDAVLIDRPFVFSLTIRVPVVRSKSSRNYGKPPANAGDFDNFVGSFTDAAKHAGIVGDDNLSLFRGIIHPYDTDPVVPHDGPWEFDWAFWESWFD